MDYSGQYSVLVIIRARLTYLDEEVSICASESLYTDDRRQCFLSLKVLVQVDPKVLLYAQRLQQESTHPHYALLGSIALVFQRIKQNQNDEVVRPLGVHDERPESPVALRDFPEQHDHLGRKSNG